MWIVSVGDKLPRDEGNMKLQDMVIKDINRKGEIRCAKCNTLLIMTGSDFMPDTHTACPFCRETIKITEVHWKHDRQKT